MSKNISKDELNRMAALDGEAAFFPGESDSAILPKSFDNAMAFTSDIKKGLCQNVADEPIPDAWISMIHRENLVSSTKVTSVSIIFSLFKESFNNMANLFEPRYAFGGGFALILSLGIFFQMDQEQIHWPEIAASKSLVPPAGSYFDSPRVAFRGEKKIELYFETDKAGDVKTPRNGNVFYDAASVLSGRLHYSWVTEINMNEFAPTFLAMNLQGKKLGRISGGDWEIWAWFITKDQVTKTQCTAVLLTSEPKESNRFIRLEYCPDEWSEKVTLVDIAGFNGVRIEQGKFVLDRND